MTTMDDGDAVLGQPPTRPFWMQHPNFPAQAAVTVAFLALAIDVIRLALDGEHHLALLGLFATAIGVAFGTRVKMAGLPAVWVGLILTTLAGWDPTVEYSALVFTLFALVFRGLRPVPAAVGSVVVLTVAFLVLAVDTGGSLLTGSYLAAVAGTFAATALGTALRLQDRYWAALEQHALDLVINREQLAQRRVMEERVRIARDLHDAIGHQVAVVSVHLGAIEMTAGRDPVAMTRSLAAARGAVRSILSNTHRTVAVLRSGSSDPGPSPTIEAVAGLIRSFEQIGLQVETAISDPLPSTDTLTGVTAYRVVQEALTNAQHYGVGAVRLVVADEGDTVRITAANRIGDRRPRSSSGGFGLVGMRERVESAGGELSISESGDGFMLTASLPLGGVEES